MSREEVLIDVETFYSIRILSKVGDDEPKEVFVELSKTEAKELLKELRVLLGGEE